MIRRNLARPLHEAASQYPIVLVTGPRQSGKTTLCRSEFPDLRYVSLEAMDVREFATRDPRGFLAEVGDGAILDEVQNVPSLLSYLQGDVDENPAPGRFILTGSQHLGLTAAVSQSLAGRVRVLKLLPPSLDEIRRFPKSPGDLWETLWMGAYPRIHDRGIRPEHWYSDYVEMYVQRDVRQVLNVGDLLSFNDFIGLCAGRTAQPVNLSTLGSDAGITHNTAKAWLSVLETGFLCFRLPAWRPALTRQMTKAAKLHWFDSGLICHILGIRKPGQLVHHPLRGAIFESWVAAEIYKASANRGETPRLHHFRDAKGLEVDLIVEAGDRTALVEAKSGATLASDAFTPLHRLAEIMARTFEIREMECDLIHAGRETQKRSRANAIPWERIPEWF